MKILLVQNSTYIPTYGGANKANRLILERLAAHQHNCRAVAAAWGLQGGGGESQFRRELAQRGINVTHLSSQAIVFGHHGVEVHAVEDVYQFRAYAANQIKTFAPTWTLVSSEDPGQVLLEAALEASPSRVIYLARTLQLLPFGPASFFPSPTRTRLLRRTAAVIAISDTARQYIRQWSGIEAVVLRPPTYGSGPFPCLGCFERGFVTMLNPCAVKGIAILIALARSLPDVQFAAVPTWGTTRADRAALEQLANVQLLPPADDIDVILAQTRVLLQPSLWLETWGRISMEAMLRGIPMARVFTALAYMTGLPFLERLCRQYFGDDINRLRARVGLPPVTDWHAWLRCAQQNIGAWPEWFAEPDANWLPNLAEVGFLTFDPAEVGEVPAQARDFLNDGEPPVLITGGTGTYLNSEFYTVCLEACRLLDCRALLVTRHRQHIPGNLPAKVKWFAYLPFGSVMPHAAAIVHHGGMSTASRALTVGVPQLALAEGLDRPDTAARFERLGVARHLLPAHWQPERVAEALRWLTGSAQVRQRCRALARRVSESDPAAAVCAVIEGLASQENDAVQAPPSDSTADDLSARLSKLSPEKRALLALALEKNKIAARTREHQVS